MSSVCGMYFGNTTISIALFKDGNTEVVTNDSGDRVTPAVVSHNQSEFITGMAAKASLTHNATGIVINNKQLLNDELSTENIEEILQKLPCTSTVKEGNEIVFSFTQANNKILTASPQDIAAHLFKKMYSIASNVIRSKSELKVVISVPLHFSSDSRLKVASAAESSGFEVLQVISEPSAAVLSYNLESNDTILVYRLGGISCDATVVQLDNGLYKILSTVHNPKLGGNFFSKLLADYIAKEFMNKWKLDPQESKRSMLKLIKQAEFCKNVLSTKASTSVFIESLCDGVDWEQNMTRPRFESLISPHMSKYLDPIKECLKTADLSVDGITKVILCGASTKIPKLQSAIIGMFPSSVEVLSDKPDEIIAEGCARQASYLESAWDTDCEHLNMEVPILAKDVYICDQKSKKVQLHIPSSTPLPSKIKFQTDSLGEFVIYEESVDVDSNILGTASFSIENSKNGFQANVTEDKILIEAC